MDDAVQDLQPCYPIAIERVSLVALRTLLDADEATPLFDGPTDDTMQEEFDEAMELATGTSTTARFEKQRRKIRDLLKHWEGDLDGEIGGVLVTQGAAHELDMFWTRIQERVRPTEESLAIDDETFERVEALHRTVQRAADERPLVLARDDDVFLPVASPDDQP